MWGSHHVSTHARIQTCRGCKRHGFCRMPLLAALGACRSVMKSAWVCTVQAPWRASTANAHLPSDSEDISPSEPSRRRRCPGASLPFSLCPKKKTSGKRQGICTLPDNAMEIMGTANLKGLSTMPPRRRT